VSTFFIFFIKRAIASGLAFFNAYVSPNIVLALVLDFVPCLLEMSGRNA
jgi:hypothetical protein